MLTELGLSPLEEEIYLALVANGPSAAAVLAHQLAGSGGDHDALRAALCSLEDRGFVGRDGHPENAYTAVDPAIALAGPLQSIQDDFRRLESYVGVLSARHRRQQSMVIDAFVEIIADASVGHEFLLTICAAAETEIMAMERPPYGEPQTSPNKLEMEALQRGVTHRILYEQAAVDMPGRAAEILAGVQAGELARVAPTLPLRSIIVDRRIAFLPARRGGLLNDPMMVVHPGSLLDAIVGSFESIWQQAIPVDPSTSAGLPDDDGRAMVRLLAAGLTDEAIAHQLGTSIRTVQRRIAELASALGGRTRFQIGVQAVRRGWL